MNFDVRHASPPPVNVPQQALSVEAQAPAVHEAIRRRELQGREFKGPLGSYVLHHDRIALNFAAEKERLKRDIPQALALRARYEGLKRLVDYVHQENKAKTPEIEVEWMAVRAAKTKLQDSKNKSLMHVVAADARNVLPVWQTSVDDPMWIRTSYHRVQELFYVQSLISKAAANRLAEYQSLHDQQKFLKEQREAIRKLERSIHEKLEQLPASTYELKEFTCLRIPCCMDLQRYPKADALFETVAKYYRSAETNLKDTLETLEQMFKQMQENPGQFVSEGYKAGLTQYRGVLDAQLQNCRAQSDSILSGKADYLVSLGLASPEIKRWVERAQVELEDRIHLLLFRLQDLSMLDQFEQRLAGYLTTQPAAAPVSAKPVVKLVSTSHAAKHSNSPAPHEKPPEIDWLKMQAVPPYNDLTTLLPNQDLIKLVIPPSRELSGVPADKWTLVDHWKNGLVVILPQITGLLHSLKEINRSIIRLQLQVVLLAQVYKGMHPKKGPSREFTRQLPWILSLLADMREAANRLSKRREEIRADYQQNMQPLHTLISKMENAVNEGKSITTTTESVDEEARELQGLMEPAVHLLSLVEGVAVAEWSYGESLKQVMSALEEYPASNKKAAVQPRVCEVPAKPVISDAISKLMAIADVRERMIALEALETEGAEKERKKLDKLAQLFLEESERLDSLVDQLLTIGVNWAHLDNLAAGIKNSRLPQSGLNAPLNDLVRGWDAMKSDIAAYGSFIPEVLKKLKSRVLWLEEKLAPHKKHWREIQQGFLMRTPEGNQERNVQLEQEIGKNLLAIAALETFWKAGEEKCLSFAASLNELHEKGVGAKSTLVSETHYQTSVKLEVAPAQVAAPVREEKEKVASHREWVLLSGDDDGKVMDLSGFGALGGPSQPPAAAPAPSLERTAAAEPLSLSGIEQAAKELGDLAAKAAAGSPIPDLSASQSATHQAVTLATGEP